MENKLTPTQERVFNFLKNYLGNHGYPPTLREVASHFGLKGPRGPQKTLQILERKGYVHKTPGGSRAIEILKNKIGSPQTALVQGRHGGLPYRKKYEGPVTVPTFSLPIVGRVTAGEPILAIENIEGYINLDRTLVSSENVFLLRIEGDSMIEAHIQDGDFALVQPQSHAENGEIVVALIDNEATIKRIFKQRDFIRLEPANPKMEPIVIKKGEKKVSIVGKVVGIFRKF
ncbi:MAG: repressor LexA [Deltaproteobacteria bacterium RBG_16_50_11]|nr:MAG: repressor LexA [Deltaproteobacteria bacterium RBG_16_50_11]